MPYLVRYLGSMLSRCAREPDGRTAFERRKGRAVERGLPPFAEVVLYPVPKTTKPPARVEERWLKGIFVGVRDDTDEVFILNKRGLLTARSVKRVEAGSRYNKELLARCTARPWERFVRSNPRSVSGDVCHRWAASGSSSTGHSQATPIRNVDLLMHGYTEGCPGCNAARVDGSSRNHSEICRERQTNLIALSSEGRQQRAEEAELCTAREPPLLCLHRWFRQRFLQQSRM